MNFKENGFWAVFFCSVYYIFNDCSVTDAIMAGSTIILALIIKELLFRDMKEEKESSLS